MTRWLVEEISLCRARRKSYEDWSRVMRYLLITGDIVGLYYLFTKCITNSTSLLPRSTTSIMYSLSRCVLLLTLANFPYGFSLTTYATSYALMSSSTFGSSDYVGSLSCGCFVAVNPPQRLLDF